ncbi:MAG: sodium/proton-translocating pyrophosphatase, partial [Myxococcales bacterium]|nr:sodium/proton-translocating pyrophosphatase [Myxococcales bacterium]
MQIEHLIIGAPAAGVVALLYAFITSGWIGRQEPGTPRMKAIGDQIARGAMAFLAAEYKVLGIFVVIVAAGLAALYGATESGSPLVGVSFVVGALCSGLAGYFGMRVATQANVRTAAAARTGLAPALRVAFRGGAVMGMSVVGLALVGFGALFFVLMNQFGVTNVDTAQVDFNKIISILAGFSMGASSIALFARVGGGIYTKAADVGADLVGKVEAGIPEDHFLNPATIADNVGD